MNLREGTRRLALLLGVAGVIFGGFASYMELQAVLNQRARHNKFEQLAASDVLQQERKCRLAGIMSGCFDLPPGWSIKPMIDPKTGERIPPEKPPSDFSGWDSVVNKGGINSIIWTKDYRVASIKTEDGQTLYPTSAPSAWLYLLIALLPALGFCIPWGAIRAIGWVVAGFVKPS
jgi:hypothetical protein